MSETPFSDVMRLRIKEAVRAADERYGRDRDWSEWDGPLREAGWDQTDIDLWFVWPNADLQGRSPADEVMVDPDAVIRAVAAAALPVV